METESKTQSDETPKKWWEKLLDNVAGSAELLKGIMVFITNPLVISSLTVVFVCWIFSSKDSETLSASNRELRDKLDKSKRKCKKLKKKLEKAKQKEFSQETSDKRNPLENDNKRSGLGFVYFDKNIRYGS